MNYTRTSTKSETEPANTRPNQKVCETVRDSSQKHLLSGEKFRIFAVRTNAKGGAAFLPRNRRTSLVH